MRVGSVGGSFSARVRPSPPAKSIATTHTPRIIRFLSPQLRGVRYPTRVTDASRQPSVRRVVRDRGPAPAQRPRSRALVYAVRSGGSRVLGAPTPSVSRLA